MFPTTPWNYGLELNEHQPAKSFEVLKKPGPIAANPFTPASVRIELRAKARRIPAWELDRFGLAGKLQASPAISKEPAETVSLIPMGAARLRITSFPVIGHASDAHKWTQTKAPPISASP